MPGVAHEMIAARLEDDSLGVSGLLKNFMGMRDRDYIVRFAVENKNVPNLGQHGAEIEILS